MRATTRGFAGALVVLVMVLALAACSVSFSASAGEPREVSDDVDAFTFRSLDADYTLSRADDGTSRLRVVETFVAEFPEADQNHGMRRSIPDTYNGQPLHPRLVSITDEAGRPRAEETDSDDGVFSMTSRADAFVHGAQTYVFTYELENVTWHFEDTGDDEFYWDVNGVDWRQPFGAVTMTLHLDGDLADSLTGDLSCYQGVQGAGDPCDIAVDGGEITAGPVSLEPHRTMTVAVGFASGTFALFDGAYLESGWSWFQLSGLVVLLLGFAWAVVVRLRDLRNSRGRRTIIAEYDPPPLDALESAVFLSKKARAVPAEVLEQAVRGSIRLQEAGRSAFGRMRLEAVLVDRSRATDDDGRMLLAGLFGDDAGPGAVFEFGSNNARLSLAAEKILGEAAATLTSRGLYREVPVRRRVLPGAVLFLGTAIAFGGGVAMLVDGFDPLWPLLLLILPFLLLFLGCGLLAHRPLSPAGAELRDHLAGLKQFIEWAEADRIRMLQSPRGAERVPVDTDDPQQMLRIYEPLLPYAVVFGQEKQWAERLAVLYPDGTSPGWYVGTTAFDAGAFSAGIGALSASAASSSDTSGGTSGGGSAGGGGGGGGGGGV